MGVAGPRRAWAPAPAMAAAPASALASAWGGARRRPLAAAFPVGRGMGGVQDLGIGRGIRVPGGGRPGQAGMVRGGAAADAGGAAASVGGGPEPVAALANALEVLTPYDKVEVLTEALPYMRKFAGKTLVVKYGGAAMKDPRLKKRVIDDVVLLSYMGMRIVLVHGGGPEINSWLGKVGIEPQFRNGLRVTDADTMEVVEMVLVGKVNKEIVSLIHQAGGSSIGICGKDGQTILARQIGNDIGFVGEVARTNTRLIDKLVEEGYIPVVASVADDASGQALNINADTVAGEIAAGLGAEKLILMTDVTGVLTDKNDVNSLVRSASIRDGRAMIEDGTVQGGMIPKVQCCIRSIAQGVKAAHIIDGRQPHSLLLEVLTNDGTGTMITEDDRR